MRWPRCSFSMPTAASASLPPPNCRCPDAGRAPLLAKALDTSIEELIGGEARRHAKRGPAPKIQQQLERVSQLPRARQRMVSEVLDSLLAQAR